MNYWLLTTEYPPHYGGGISTYCDHTARMLAGYGHAVTVFIPDESVKDHLITEEEKFIRVVRFSTNRTGMLNHLGHIARVSYEFAFIVRDMIRQYGKPDIIESQEYLGIPYYLLQFKLLKYPEFTGIPLLLTLHSPAFLYLYYNREGENQFPNYWTGEMEMSCISSADWVVAPSAYIVEEIRNHQTLRATNISVIRNPYRFPDQEGVKEISRNKIVFYGKLSPTKGIFELLSYMKDLWDNGFPHPLIIVGGTDKVYYPEMKTMGQVVQDAYGAYIKRGLIRLTGKIPPSKKDEYLSDAHVVLIPSRVDNLPYACIEAMGLGKVVLVSKQGGQAELIQDGINGFIFDHRSPLSFEAQLARVLDLDNDALSAIGQAAAQEIKSLLQYERIYEEKMAVIDPLIRDYQEPGSFPFIRSPYPEKKIKTSSRAHGLLSVVIPYFNLGPYIKECVTSLLACHYSALEILIIDDGSTDPESIRALQQFEGIPNVTVFRKKNEGLAMARNYGAHLAKGEFLAFLDADDKVFPDYYPKAIMVLTQYDNLAFMGAWVQYFGNKKGKWIAWNPEAPYILMHNTVNSSSLIYKKAAFLDGGLNDKEVDYGIEDYESVINMLKHGYRGAVLPECLFYYRIRKNSMYRGLTKYKAFYSYQYISNKHKDFYNTFASQIFNVSNANGPSYSYDNPSFKMQVANKTEYPNNPIGRLKTYLKRFPFIKKTLLRIIKIR